MTQKLRIAGFTLVELMIVVAIIAIICTIMIPRLMAARVATNEEAAISTLQSIAAAQAEVQRADAIDTDHDGVGEYGYLAELVGTTPRRVSEGDLPMMGAFGTDELNPPILSGGFGRMMSGEGTRQGYLFKMFLPAATKEGAVAAIPEAPMGGAFRDYLPNPNNGEHYWCCYAWPLEYNQDGRRAFFVNQDGVVFQTPNFFPNYPDMSYFYNGQVSKPLYDEAYTLPSMASEVRAGTAGGHNNTIWTRVE